MKADTQAIKQGLRLQAQSEVAKAAGRDGRLSSSDMDKLPGNLEQAARDVLAQTGEKPTVREVVDAFSRTASDALDRVNFSKAGFISGAEARQIGDVDLKRRVVDILALQAASAANAMEAYELKLYGDSGPEAWLEMFLPDTVSHARVVAMNLGSLYDRGDHPPYNFKLLAAGFSEEQCQKIEQAVDRVKQAVRALGLPQDQLLLHDARWLYSAQRRHVGFAIDFGLGGDRELRGTIYMDLEGHVTFGYQRWDPKQP